MFLTRHDICYPLDATSHTQRHGVDELLHPKQREALHEDSISYWMSHVDS